MRLVIFVAAALSTLASPAGAAETVVLELFTSQGCSSCPPADRLLQTLAAEPGVLALSRPVTYWDRLGWKDTLATPENTAKQRAYSAALGREGRVYTPQIVIDGVRETVGSDAASVRALIASAKAAPPAAELTVTKLTAGRWRVGVAGGNGADIHLVGYVPSAHVTIEAGENEGETIDYANAVTSDVILARASGAEMTIETPVLSPAGGTRFAVIVQDGTAGPIRAAAVLGQSAP